MVYLLAFCVFGFLLYHFPPMRKAAVVVGGLIAVIIAGIMLSDQMSKRAAASLIPATQLDISNLNLAANYSMYQLNGEIKNRSAHRLTGLTLTVTAYDCPGTQITSSCATIGEDNDVYVSLDVPPGQVRAIESAFVTLNNMPKVKGKFLWSYTVAETRGAD